MRFPVIARRNDEAIQSYELRVTFTLFSTETQRTQSFTEKVLRLTSHNLTSQISNNIGGGILVYPKPSNPEHGYTEGNALYEGRTTAAVTATAYDGYKFVNWTIDGVEVSKDNPYSFTVTEDVELVANFEEGVGIVETLRATSLQVYPNPTTGELWVDCRDGARPVSTMTPTTITNIEIFDVMGRSVSVETQCIASLQSQIAHRPSQIEINISHLPTGVYFLRIATDEGVVLRKVVKQ